MSDNVTLKLSDEVIGQIAKNLQIAILTGTDIVDNLRQVDLQVNEGFLYLTEDYKDNFENNLEKMVSETKVNAENSGLNDE